MARIVSDFNLYEALLEEGFKVPEECAGVELLLPADGLVQLRWTVNVRNEELAALGRILVRFGEPNATSAPVEGGAPVEGDE